MTPHEAEQWVESWAPYTEEMRGMMTLTQRERREFVATLRDIREIPETTR